MALTDRIMALTLRIAAAFNARVQAPASGYDVYVLNGGTMTQAQWLASLVPVPTPQLPAPIFVERYDGLADGAAWPGAWSINAASATTTISQQRGAVITQAVAGAGALAQQSPAILAEVGVLFTVLPQSNSIISVAINTDKSGTATNLAPTKGYLFELNTATGSALLYEVVGGTATQVGSGSVGIGNLQAKVRLERVGNLIRAKAWSANSFEPANWSASAPIAAGGTPVNGYVSIGARNTAATAQTTYFDDVLAYSPEESYAAINAPGVVALASAAEAAAGSDARKVITAALLGGLAYVGAAVGLSNTTNWNTLIKPGVYLFNGGGGNPTGFPSGLYNYGHLIVFAQGTGVTQVYLPDANQSLAWRHGFSASPNGFGTKAWNVIAASSTTPAT